MVLEVKQLPENADGINGATLRVPHDAAQAPVVWLPLIWEGHLVHIALPVLHLTSSCSSNTALLNFGYKIISV